MSDIPTIDLSVFETGSPDQQQAAADSLGAAAAQYGCVAITGHGIEPGKLEKAFEFARRFYTLPDGDKLQARRPDNPMHHRGWSAPGREKAGNLEKERSKDFAEGKASHLDIADFKETYEIGSEGNEMLPNVWAPDEVVPGFKDFMAAFYWDLHAASSRILEALLMALKLAPAECDDIRKAHSPHFSQLRLAHYLPVSEAMAKDETTTRLAAHRDFGSYTFLFQDGENAGLEFQHPSTKDWMPAPPTPQVMYLNIADIFNRYSNDRFPSSLHRVTAPRGPNGRLATKSRYSIVYFVGPAPTAICAPPDSLIKEDGKQKFKPIGVMDFYKQMFEATQSRAA